MNAIQKMMYGQPVTLAEFRALDDDPPAAVRDSAKRRIASTRVRYEHQVRAKQLNGVARATEQVREQQAAIRERLDEADKQISKITKAAKAGRVDPDEAERDIARIIKDIQTDRQTLGQMEQAIARIQEVADTDPAEWQLDMHERFPSTRQALPIITEDWLLGESDDDPLGVGGDES